MYAVTITLILLALTCVASLLRRVLAVPLPFLQIGVGVVAAVLPIGLHVAFEPHTFMLLFIPPLLFADGWRMPRRELRALALAAAEQCRRAGVRHCAGRRLRAALADPVDAAIGGVRGGGGGFADRRGGDLGHYRKDRGAGAAHAPAGERSAAERRLRPGGVPFRRRRHP